MATAEQGNARLLLRRAGENAGFKADPLLEISRMLLSMNDANGAHWAITKALSGNSRHLGSLAQLVDVLIGMGKLDDASQALEDLDEIFSGRAETHQAKGSFALASGDLEAAQRHFAAAYQIAPSRKSVHRLFNAQVEAGNIEDALKTIRVWILIHPDDVSSRHALAEKLISVGAFRPAQLVYEGILKRTDADPYLLNNLAYVAHKVGDTEARTYARRAVEMDPDEAGFLDTYGWILSETGDPERGLKLLRDAFTRQATNQEIRYHIALALLQLERVEAAKRELVAALQSKRTFPSLNDAVALLQQLEELD
jgi:Tfp pilus assembly protein PilF